MDMLDEHLLALLAMNVDMRALLSLRATSKRILSALNRNPHIWSQAIQQQGCRAEVLFEYISCAEGRTIQLQLARYAHARSYRPFSADRGGAAYPGSGGPGLIFRSL